jgi:threonine dehydrogenase-like Zn-dependent dehydrogenase
MHGAFSEPLACCLHALDVARIRPGTSVAVLGGGVIGMLMVELASRAGARTVVVVTRQAARRALAASIGATHTIDPAAGDVTDWIRAVVPDGVDVTLECAGVPETFRQSLTAVRSGGTAVLFGVMAKGRTVEVEPYDLLVREVRLEAAYLNPHTHQRAADMIAAGTLALDPLISRVVGLDALPDELGGEPKQGDVKVMVRPGG